MTVQRTLAHIGLLAIAWASSADAAPMTMDIPSRVNNIDIACTGLGETKTDPRWAGYPLRVEFFDSRRRWIPGGDVTLADTAGRKLVSVNCPGLWLLIRVAPGDYIVNAAEDGARPRITKIHLGNAGQMRMQVVFPDIVNQQEAAPGTVRVMPANDSADFLNDKMKATNAAIDAKYKTEQARYQAQLKSYETEKKKAADAAAHANTAQADYARQMAAWHARVKACKNGETARCGK